MENLTFDLFKKHGKRIKEYFSWPDDLRSALPTIEKLKADLNGVSPQRAPLASSRTRQQRSGKKRYRQQRSGKKRYRLSGVRVDWNSPKETGSNVTKREYVRFQFREAVASHGNLSIAAAKTLARDIGCTINAIRNEYYSWSQSPDSSSVNAGRSRSSRSRKPANRG